MKDRILSPTQNKVISGYYLEGLEFQQMIEEMMKKKDISRFQAQNSIKGAKSSGLKRLREELSPYLSQI